MLSAAILAPTPGIDPFISANYTTVSSVGSAARSGHGPRRESRVTRRLRVRFGLALVGVVSAAAVLSGLGSFHTERPSTQAMSEYRCMSTACDPVAGSSDSMHSAVHRSSDSV